MYEVNERGAPELFERGGRKFLMPGDVGSVTPLGRGSKGGNTVDARAFFYGDITSEVLPQVEEMMRNQEATLMGVLPQMVDARVVRGIGRGKFG